MRILKSRFLEEFSVHSFIIYAYLFYVMFLDLVLENDLFSVSPVYFLYFFVSNPVATYCISNFELSFSKKHAQRAQLFSGNL